MIILNSSKYYLLLLSLIDFNIDLSHQLLYLINNKKNIYYYQETEKLNFENFFKDHFFVDTSIYKIFADIRMYIKLLKVICSNLFIYVYEYISNIFFFSFLFLEVDLYYE